MKFLRSAMLLLLLIGIANQIPEVYNLEYSKTTGGWLAFLSLYAILLVLAACLFALVKTLLNLRSSKLWSFVETVVSIELLAVANLITADFLPTEAHCNSAAGICLLWLFIGLWWAIDDLLPALQNSSPSWRPRSQRRFIPYSFNYKDIWE